MFPFNFEWVWDMGHVVFHGGLWYALSVLGLGITYCVIKAVLATADKGKNHHDRANFKTDKETVYYSA